MGRYGIDFFINESQEAEELLNSLFTAFSLQKNGESIYVIIDEYDHFANELLGFYPERFKTLVSKNGKVRKWYEILKKGTEKIVEKFNPAIEFTEIDMISMLYYLGYLTISGELIGIPELAIPNKVMKAVYEDNYEQRR